LKLERLIAALETSLTGDKRLAVAAAGALARMGAEGERRLERQTLQGMNRIP